MSTNTIQLVEVDGSIHTSYGRNGRTRDGNRPIPWVEVRRVDSFKPPRTAWRASRGTAAALLRVDRAARAAGWPGLRLTEAVRDHKLIAVERAKLDTWIAAGKPDPKSAAFSPKTMRTVYIKRVNETNHQWGGAVDLDVYAWAEDGKAKGLTGNEALAVLWTFMAAEGFTPIIAEPNLHQDESWHFDHYGPLAPVRAAFRAHGLDAAGLTAMVGCILAGTFIGDKTMERLVQARLLIAGHWCGKPDGVLGKQTREALAAAGLVYEGPLPAPATILGDLDKAEVGLHEVADA